MLSVADVSSSNLLEFLFGRFLPPVECWWLSIWRYEGVVHTVRECIGSHDVPVDHRSTRHCRINRNLSVDKVNKSPIFIVLFSLLAATPCDRV